LKDDVTKSEYSSPPFIDDVVGVNPLTLIAASVFNTFVGEA